MIKTKEGQYNNLTVVEALYETTSQSGHPGHATGPTARAASSWTRAVRVGAFADSVRRSHVRAPDTVRLVGTATAVACT